MDRGREVEELEISMMPAKYKRLLIDIAVAIATDLLLLSIFIIWMKPTPDISIAEILILPAIFIINVGLAVAFKFTIKKLYPIFLVNSVFAPLIFHLLFKAWFVYSYDKNFDGMQFSANGKHYELLLDRRDTSYSFSELSTGSSMQFMRGQYRISHDTVYLTDPVNQMIVYKDTLIGFAKKKIVLKEE